MLNDKKNYFEIKLSVANINNLCFLSCQRIFYIVASCSASIKSRNNYDSFLFKKKCEYINKECDDKKTNLK